MLAINGKYRISEAKLLALPWLFGSLGGILGMYLFRHKTKKIYFILNNFNKISRLYFHSMQFTFILILVFSLSFSTSTDFNEPTFFELPIQTTPSSLPVLSFSIGNPSQQLTLLLSTTLEGVFVFSNKIHPNGFNTDNSSSYKETSPLAISTSVGQAILSNEVLRIEHGHDLTMLYNYNFYLITNAKEYNTEYNGILGLGNPLNTDKHKSGYSLVEFLKETKSISYNLFYVYTNKQNEMTLHIGLLPPYYNINKRFYTCKMNIEVPEWQCRLHSVYLPYGNIVYQVNTYMTFAMELNVLCVDKEFFREVVIKSLFRKELQNGTCKEMLSEQSDYISCDSEFEFDKYERDKHVIAFIMGKWNFKVDVFNKFITTTPRRKDSVMQVCHNYNNEWAIGSVYLNGEKTLVFDLPKKSVHISVN